jgi:hypothetical protein
MNAALCIGLVGAGIRVIDRDSDLDLTAVQRAARMLD